MRKPPFLFKACIGTMNRCNFVAPVFQPARRAAWKVGVTFRFMESLHDFEIAHRDHEPISAPVFAPASWTAAVLCRFCADDRCSKSARGLAQSKTLRGFGRFMGGEREAANARSVPFSDPCALEFRSSLVFIPITLTRQFLARAGSETGAPVKAEKASLRMPFRVKKLYGSLPAYGNWILFTPVAAVEFGGRA